MTTPLIKWAGGKRQLLPQIMPLIGKIPEGSRYFEPFFGGGAVFFALEPDSAHINDFNPALANLYTAVRDDPLMLHALLKSTEDLYNSSSPDERKEMYRLSREKFNEPNGRMGVEGAARLIFLNKTCYNGLYRENKQGSFNVPWGKKEHVSLVDMEINGIERYPEKEVIFVLDGDGWKTGARQWLKDRIDDNWMDYRDQGKMIRMMTIAEFMDWFNHEEWEQ